MESIASRRKTQKENLSGKNGRDGERLFWNFLKDLAIG